MKITLSSKKLQDSGFELIEELFEVHSASYGKPEELENNIFYKIYQDLLPEIEIECNKHLDRYSYFTDATIKAFPDIFFPKEKEITIYFAQEDFCQKTIANHYSNNQQDFSKSTGIFCVNGGEGISKSLETFFVDEFIVLISVPPNKEMEEISKTSKCRAIPKLMSTLNTLTHELNHALLFMLNSSGLTPSEIDDLYSCSEYNMSVKDCTFGEFFLRDEICFMGGVFFEEISSPAELMEFYVEEKGLEFLYNLDSYKNGEIEKYIK
jgi:hypothetical protein